MGKKNKKMSKEDFERGLQSKFYGPGAGAQEMLKRYGVEGTRSVKPDNRGVAPTGREHRELDDVKGDLQEAMMNDYDTRRTFEAAALAGNKAAKKFAKKGFKPSNMSEAWDVYKDMKKEYVGGGGMRGPKNEAGLTYAAVKSDRDKLVDSLSNTGGGSDEEGQPTNPVAPNADPSEYLANARARVQLHDEEILNGQYSENLYDKGYRPTDGGGFLARYKLKMKDSGLNLS